MNNSDNKDQIVIELHNSTTLTLTKNHSNISGFMKPDSFSTSISMVDSWAGTSSHDSFSRPTGIQIRDAFIALYPLEDEAPAS